MTAGGARSLRVALLQLRAFELADHEATWAELLLRIDEAAQPPGAPAPQLIVAPEASYPAYYLHSRADYDAAGVLPDARVEAMLAERAQRYGVALTVGLVQRGSGESLSNVAVQIAPSGEVLARTAKHFLWHFDRAWFGASSGPGSGPGSIAASPLVEVGPARCGLFICADGRLPEIPRALSVAGAELLIDPTAWVASGRDRAALSNPQVEYMLAARAIENGCWIVAADKVGTEAGTIVYAGRSGVVDPSGRWRAQAPSDAAGIVRYTIDLAATPARPPVERRPELYGGAAIAGATSRA
ncbi:MAG: carbon-nitrogen hydrolase family protein, partial [Chloroflexi bacterium]|nr:carbon-nitrogen hydrolase family protein [Chloroflexota bacterium]